MHFHDSLQAHVSVHGACQTHVSGEALLVVCRLARFNKTSFDLGFALCLFIALLLLGPGLVTYVMSRGSSYLYLAGNANIREERFP
jgi:hypothetical protein